jgi:hypothetical protein
MSIVNGFINQLITGGHHLVWMQAYVCPTDAPIFKLPGTMFHNLAIPILAGIIASVWPHPE